METILEDDYVYEIVRVTERTRMKELAEANC